jgi:hypothetical protein
MAALRGSRDLRASLPDRSAPDRSADGSQEEDMATDTTPSLRPGRGAFALLLLAAALGPTALHAQRSADVAANEEMQVTADEVRADRKAIVARYMALGDEQANKFWPIYDAYQKAIAEDNKKLDELGASFRGNYASMTDKQVETLLKGALERESKLIETRRQYRDKFGNALRPKQVLRLYQIEFRMDAVVRYELAGTAPLVQTSR